MSGSMAGRRGDLVYGETQHHDPLWQWLTFEDAIVPSMASRPLRANQREATFGWTKDCLFLSMRW